jgi:hypothetical protein
MNAAAVKREGKNNQWWSPPRLISKSQLTLWNVAITLEPSATVYLLSVSLGVRVVVRVEHQTGL